MQQHGSPPRPRRSAPPIDSITTPKARSYRSQLDRVDSHRTEFTTDTQLTSNTTATANAGAPRRRRVEAPPTKRNTNIQVCIRVRPLLPSDNKPPPSQQPQQHGNGSNRRLFPPTPGENGRMKYTKLTVGMPKTKHRSTSITERQKSNRSVIRVNSSSSNNNDIGPEPSHERDGGPSSTPQEAAWDVSANSTTVSQAAHTNPETTRTNAYTFDHVFGPNRSTAELYNETVKDNVMATMEGYHASVFAYGQTATGKTFTMSGNKQGSPNDPNSKGIIQRAVQECFDYIHGQKDDPREFLLRVSFMEIYNEVIYDLLASNTRVTPYRTASTKSMMSQGSSTSIQPPSVIRIFESKNEGVVIRGLKEEIVTCQEQVLSLLAAGERRRQTGSTASNKQSSRSHSIFRLIVESRRRLPRPSNVSQKISDASSVQSDSIASSTFAPVSAAGPVRVSTLSLVDLAGSESVRNTGSTGTRQREGQYINKSLLTLGHVVYKLAELRKDKSSHDDSIHIPYRDSKLTRLLQSSLSGNAQICIICNISPVARHLDESHLTLKFASRAKRIRQNAVVTEVVDERTLLENYRNEIELLKKDLKEAREAQKSLHRSGDAESIGSPQLSIDRDGEDSHVLAQAIGNLERLILKTTTAEERKAKKERKERRSKTPTTIKAFFNGGAIKHDPFLNDSDNDMDDELLGDETSLTLDSAGNMIPKNPLGEDDMSITDTSIGDESTIVEGRRLISELHRIQGLLSTVQKKKGTPRSRIGSPVIVTTTSNPGTPHSMTATPSDRNDEVERLRAQLHDQAVTTSLRKADSSFLQKELLEKNQLLTETSKFLESVEERQLALEAENMKLKMELAKYLDTIKDRDEVQRKNVEVLKEKDEEIRRLKGEAIKATYLTEKEEELRKLRGSLK